MPVRQKFRETIKRGDYLEIFQKTAVCFVALTAVFWDLKKGKIPNLYIIIGLLAGAVFQTACLGAWGTVRFFGGAVFPVAVLSGLFYFRMIGAGDVKLLAVLGGFLGMKDIGICMLAACLIGGVLSLGLMMRRGNLVRRFIYFAEYSKDFFRTGEWRPYRNGEKGGEFPLTIAVLLSVFCYAGGIL